MLIQNLKILFRKNLEKMRDEIAAYQQEDRLWVVEESIANSAGNLCLHLVGNLNTYLGAVIGETGYIRQRDLEFSLRNIPRKELLEKTEATIYVVEKALEKLKEEDLDKEYPLLVFAGKTTTGYFLVHLAVHLGYHLGQINYHRRLLDV